MNRPAKNRLAFLLFLPMFLIGQIALADNELDKADSAVADVLFDYDGAEEFASYSVSESGFVDITFASNIPTPLYGEIVRKLKNHQDIDGVLAGNTGPICTLF